MDAALVADGVRRTYGDVEALAGVSLSVAPGEVFALVGPNGAGKTTLVRALTGTTNPDSGTVSVLGSDSESVARSQIGLLPQAFGPPGRLSARELVAYFAGLYDDARDPEAVLAEVGLSDAGDTWYEDLSGGQQRRACVAATLANEPDVLFLDEPTTGIDPAGRRALWTLLEDLAAGGTTIFLTTHDMAEAERLADRVGLLADGRLVEVGPPGELVAEYGGESRLMVETDADPDALSGTPYDARREGANLVVEGIDPAGIGAVVEVLDSRGVEYEALTWRQPDLEDIYLRLAGESADTNAGRTDERTIPAGGER
jgi:ABC-2 type transport system ATP-binding protein